jgi:hypothetical protein
MSVLDGGANEAKPSHPPEIQGRGDGHYSTCVHMLELKITVSELQPETHLCQQAGCPLFRFEHCQSDMEGWKEVAAHILLEMVWPLELSDMMCYSNIQPMGANPAKILVCHM